MAREQGIPQTEAEQAVLELISGGHLRVREGEGPNGVDLFEMVIKERE